MDVINNPTSIEIGKALNVRLAVSAVTRASNKFSKNLYKELLQKENIEIELLKKEKTEIELLDKEKRDILYKGLLQMEIELLKKEKREIELLNKKKREIEFLEKEKRGNLILSPFSLLTALAMITSGAKGKTQSQV